VAFNLALLEKHTVTVLASYHEARFLELGKDENTGSSRAKALGLGGISVKSFECGSSLTFFYSCLLVCRASLSPCTSSDLRHN
jgi:hypothetical protein